MSSDLTRFAFIDAVHAAEILGVSQDTIVDWVASGKLKAYGGKPGNPFLRSNDVAMLMRELGVHVEEQPRRVKSATARVQQRLTADARWSDIGDDDIAEWARRADPARRQAARTAAAAAIKQLEKVLMALEEP
jgi:hypothetical protein